MRTGCICPERTLRSVTGFNNVSDCGKRIGPPALSSASGRVPLIWADHASFARSHCCIQAESPFCQAYKKGGPAGCGRTLCRLALPRAVVALGMHQTNRNGRSWCLLRTPHSLPLVVRLAALRSNCQLILVRARFIRRFQAFASRRRVLRSGILRFPKHCREKSPISISA